MQHESCIQYQGCAQRLSSLAPNIRAVPGPELRKARGGFPVRPVRGPTRRKSRRSSIDTSAQSSIRYMPSGAPCQVAPRTGLPRWAPAGYMPSGAPCRPWLTPNLATSRSCGPAGRGPGRACGLAGAGAGATTTTTATITAAAAAAAITTLITVSSQR
jgi:hypothetical protein